MEVMIVNYKFHIEDRDYLPGEVYFINDENKNILQRRFQHFAKVYNKPKYVNTAKFLDLDLIIKKATIKTNFNNLLIFRKGGIGDLIALSSIVNYFKDKRVHFITQKGKYGVIFDWFEIKPKVYELHVDAQEPFLFGVNQASILTKYSYWAKLQMENTIEEGHNRNWFELFFSFLEEENPPVEYLRPQLRTDRINNYIKSNIMELGTGKKSLLICNKATAMMRTCHVIDILNNLPERIVNDYEIFVYEMNLSDEDKIKLSSLKDKYKLIRIGKSDFKTFLLDCYDADRVICVDTGAHHFREGIQKPSIGLYNSFTVDSRCKYYQYTKSFDIKSDCEFQPCFLHESTKPFCHKVNRKEFAAPCFDTRNNLTLNEQLTEIFENNLL